MKGFKGGGIPRRYRSDLDFQFTPPALPSVRASNFTRRTCHGVWRLLPSSALRAPSPRWGEGDGDRPLPNGSDFLG